jgi:site-specific recombinase XerD
MKRARKPAPARGTDWTSALSGFGDHLKETEKAEHTQANYYNDLLTFTAWYQTRYEERPHPQLIQAEELREYRTHLREKLGLAPATVNRRLSALRSFLRWCEALGISAEIRTPKRIAQVQPPPRWLSEKEKRHLLRQLDRMGNQRDPALVRFLLNTGLRVDELSRLRWADLTAKDRSGSVLVREGKGRKQRAVPLNAEARAAVAQVLDTHGQRKPKPQEPFLTGQRGGLTIRGIQSIVAKAGRLARLDELSPHVLRHTCFHDLAVKGVPIQVIADLAGHESLETTRRYVQPGKDDLAAAVEQIGGGEE